VLRGQHQAELAGRRAQAQRGERQGDEEEEVAERRERLPREEQGERTLVQGGGEVPSQRRLRR